MELGLSLGQDNEQDFFEFVQQVCYDTGNALLGYGHHPRPQILHVKKKSPAKQPRDIRLRKKVVEQVCFGTGKCGPRSKLKEVTWWGISVHVALGV